MRGRLRLAGGALILKDGRTVAGRVFAVLSLHLDRQEALRLAMEVEDRADLTTRQDAWGQTERLLLDLKEKRGL